MLIIFCLIPVLSGIILEMLGYQAAHRYRNRAMPLPVSFIAMFLASILYGVAALAGLIISMVNSDKIIRNSGFAALLIGLMLIGAHLLFVFLLF
jgi:hypothetical protein